MQDGCKVYMDSYVASNGTCFMVTWTNFQKPPLGGRPNTKLGDQGTLNTYDRCFILFYLGSCFTLVHVLGLAKVMWRGGISVIL